MRGCGVMAVLVFSNSILLAADGEGALHTIPLPVERVDPLPTFRIPILDHSRQNLRPAAGESVRIGDTGSEILFQPFSAEPWTEEYRWRKGAERIFQVAPFRTDFGAVPVKECRLAVPRDDAAVPEPRAAVGIEITFKTGDRSRTRLQLRGYPTGDVGLLDHEMVRDAIGMERKVCRAGDGHVLVAQASGQTIAVWRVNHQFYAQLHGSWTEELLAACVRRFGSQTSATCQVDVQRWIEDEIKLRVEQLDRAKRWQRECRGECVWVLAPYLTDQFPDVFQRFGVIAPCDSNENIQKWLQGVRDFLWANRANFQYAPERWGFVLKGHDRYDASSSRPVDPKRVDAKVSRAP